MDATAGVFVCYKKRLLKRLSYREGVIQPLSLKAECSNPHRKHSTFTFKIYEFTFLWAYYSCNFIPALFNPLAMPITITAYRIHHNMPG